MDPFISKTIALRRVVVTGMGLITPTGKNQDENWENIRNGRSGIGPITRFDAQHHASRIAGEIKNYDSAQYFDRKEVRKFDPFIQFALIAADEAVKDSGLDLAAIDKERAGTYIGSGIGGIQTIETNKEILMQKGPDRISPFFLPACIANLAAGQVSIKFGFKGPNLANCTACATGTHAIGDSMRIIQRGEADIMLAGGAEYPITPLGVAGFTAMRALSTRNDQPQKASRPFDKDRDGFVIGEGSAILVLESLEHARRRGARIYAEVVGYGFTGDAYHMTAPDPEADGAYRAMRNAVARRRAQAGGHRLHQRPRHVDRAQRQAGDPGHQAPVRGARLQAGRQLDQVHDRPHAGRHGQRRSRLHHHGPHPFLHPPDHQL